MEDGKKVNSYWIKCGLCDNTGKVTVKRFDPVLCIERTKFVDCEVCAEVDYASDLRKERIERGLIYNDRLKYYEDEIAAIDLANELSQEKKTLGGLKK